MHFLHVVGARPNFMKFAPVYRALRDHHSRQTVVHTGQHFDFNMSDVFFQQLDVPAPDINLQAGGGSHAQQTAAIISRLEPVILEQKPDWVLVYGDVNSTVAAALVCSKLLVPVAHVEAGLRSFDRTMPEEINRLLTDQVSDMLFTPSEDGNVNLAHEGVDARKVHLVGNVMIDTLVRMLPAAERSLPSDLPPEYALVTLHRPANVDDIDWLSAMLGVLSGLAERIPVLFPIHPRTRQRLNDTPFANGAHPALRLLDPLPYLEFLALQTRATVVVTDSGGIQEETTYLGVPCLTVRDNTERPVTVAIGTNILVGRNPERTRQEVERILAGERKRGTLPPLWEGRAAARIANILTGSATGSVPAAASASLSRT
jgi:UDP-N-acetylglucosamine 2-epimerase (non-hydrolysing)